MTTKAKKKNPIMTQRGQKGGLGLFVQQMALYSLTPLATQLVGSVLGNLLPRLGGAQASGAFSLPGNSKMIGLPNHLPFNSYYRLPRPSQKGGRALPKRARGHPTRRPNDESNVVALDPWDCWLE